MRIRMIIAALMLMVSMGMDAQIRVGYQTDSAKIAEYREAIGLDMSVPDFETKKPDAKVMGWRLAKMVQKLEQNYQQGTYNRMLAAIRSEILEEPNLRYIPVNKMKILKIQKIGDVITIRISTSSKNETLGKLNHEFDIKFEKGVSDNDTTNQLFSDLNRYIKEDE